MKRTFTIGSVAATLLAVSTPSVAASPWDYVSFSLVLSGDIESPGLSEDLEGYRIDVAKSLGRVAFFRTAFNGYHYEVAGTQLDASAQQFGVGARLPLSTGATPLELWGSVNYERVSLGAVGTGLGIDAGVRASLSRELDLNFTAKLHGDLDFGNADADYTGYELSLGYKVQPGISLLFSFGNYELEFSGGSQTDWDGVISVGAKFDL